MSQISNEIQPDSERRETVALYAPPGLLAAGLAQALIAAGFNVHALAGLNLPAGVKSIDGDPDSPETVDRLLHGVQTIVYAVPLHLNGRIWRSQTHLEDLRVLLKASLEAGVERFVYLSSIAIDKKSTVPCLLEAMEAEQLIEKAPFKAYLLRCAPLMGTNDDPLVEAQNVGLSSYPFTVLFGYGDTVLQPVHIDDLSHCILRCCRQNNALEPGYYVVAGHDTLTYLELLDRALHAAGRFKLKFHIPLSILLLLKLIAGKRLAERIDLSLAHFYADKNDLPKILSSERKIGSVDETIRATFASSS